MTPRFLHRCFLSYATLATLALPCAAIADAPAPTAATSGATAAASAAPVATYNDAGMHFDAPPGWEMVHISANPDGSGNADGGGDSNEATPVAAFIYHHGKSDQLAIVIKTAPFDGRVDEYDASHTRELRKDGDTFIAKNEKITLANGMPAYFVKANSGSQAGHYVETLEYLVCDGTRSIDVSYVGGEGTFDETKARNAFATLYVVAYPTRRP
jgi:hypothetical protein